jgi:hypothetical protein
MLGHPRCLATSGSACDADPRGRLNDLLDLLPEDQIETVLHFAKAIRKGRVVISAFETMGDSTMQHPDEPHTESRVG